MPQIQFKMRQTASCPAGSNPGPCHPATGDKSRAEIDFEFAGEAFTRHYHSLQQTATLPVFAPGWTHTFSDRVLSGGSYYARIIRGDGNAEYFTHLGNNTYASNQTTRKKLVKLGDGSYRIYDETGKVQHFNPDGRLIRQERSTSGLQAIDFVYDDGKLVQAIDQTGRTLTFVYTGERLSRITLPDGSAVDYSYDAAANFERATYSDGSSKRYHYNEAGLSLANDKHALTGITTENGLRYSSYGYAANGRVNLSQRHKGDGTFVEKTTIDYSNVDQPVVTLPYGEVVTYGLANEGPYRRITSMASGAGASYFVYTGGGLVQATQHSTVSTYAYTGDYLSTRYQAVGTPEERKFVTARDVNYRTTSYEVQAKSGTTYVTKLRQTFAYNSRGQILAASTIDPATSETRTVALAYCEQTDVAAGTCPLLGLLKTVDGPRTDVADITAYTYHAYDAPGCVPGVNPCRYRRGDLRKITNALGQITEIRDYNDAGRPAAVTDPNGVVTEFEYDARDRLIARKLLGANPGAEADDQITRIGYWPTGLISSVDFPDGASLSFKYDDAHRMTGISDNAGNSIAYTLNAASQRIKEDTRDSTGALQRTLARAYNTLDQLESVTDAFERVTSFTYVKGNLDQTTDAKLRVEDNNYDPLNRLTRSLRDMNGIAAETTFDYDTLDNLKQVKDPNGLNTNYDYNAFSDLMQLSSPDTGTTTYTYDSAGNRETRKDARNKTTTYSYDALDRLTGAVYADTALNETYTFDTAQAACVVGETFAIGRLTRMADQSGNTVYCYDRFGNLVRKVQTTNSRVFVLRYVYADNGQLQKIVYPDGAEADYVYDAHGRVVEVGAKVTAADPRQVVLSNATYHPFGPVAEWTYGNGRVMKRSLNQNYQPRSVEVIGAGGLNVGYEFDEVGNLKDLYSPSQMEPSLRTFGYDRLDRLTESKDGATQTLLEGYAYDKTGNRTSATVGASTKGYSYLIGTHRLASVGTTARAYDNAGNTTQIGGIAKQFVYDDSNRMSQYVQAGVVAMNYVYNGRGEQVRRHVGVADNYFLYDEAGRWMGDYKAQSGAGGAPVQQMIWLDGLPVGVIVGATPGQAAKLHYIEADALGSPRVVVDPTRGASGTAVWTWDLAGEAFGNTAPNQDPDGDSNLLVFNMRFPGQRYDSASGLNYNYFRDYDQSTGRYTQSDPIGLKGGISTYGYVGGSPLIGVDLMGLSERDVGLIRDALTKSVNRSIEYEARRPGSGYWNGFLNNLRGFYAWDDANDGCVRQAADLREDLIKMQDDFDDKWTIYQMRTITHSWVEMHSANRNDPHLILDPWLNSFRAVKVTYMECGC
ncbi:RHS repeat-associated core domain-containing protein [Tahibacter sp.]|uniref:RHS repeat-associated core domain-containing protein n=1 Tax=Tahibacter sp. TaxID=2056211 RepID=UPI0028C4EBA7|nr:RHS repeat-associated core domain-containing protein [Tahibacter sp.]